MMLKKKTEGFEPESGEFMVLFWTISFAQHCISKINYNSSLAQQQRYKKLIRTFWFKANFWFQSSSSKTLFCNFRSSVGILKWLKRGRLVRAERIQIWIGGQYYKTTFLEMNWTDQSYLCSIRNSPEISEILGSSDNKRAAVWSQA